MLALYIHKSGEARLFANRLFALSGNVDAPLSEFDDTEDPIALLNQFVRPGKLGIDKSWPSQFTLRLMEARADVRCVLGSSPVDDARMLKDAEEIALMRESSLKNDASILEAIASIREGMRESDVAAAYNRAAAPKRRLRANFPDADLLRCNCAEPHHTTDDTAPQARRFRNSWTWAWPGKIRSDMTRTVFYGEPTDEQKRVFDLVCKANAAGIAAVRPGVPLCEIDRAARKVIEDAGYGDYFIHRTGHGIGLEGHEPPDVSATDTRLAQLGMVFSIEPGVYLPGRFGVREEDLVCVTEDGVEVLNRLSHELRVIPIE